MKFTVEVELTLTDGPRISVNDVQSALADELDNVVEVWSDDSEYAVTVTSIKHHR